MNSREHSIFEYISWRDKIHPSFSENILTWMRSSGSRAAALSIVLNSYSKLSGFRGNEYLFSGIRFPELIKALGPHAACVVGSPMVARLAIPARIPFYITASERLTLWKLFQHDPRLISHQAASLFAKVEARLKHIRPRIVIVSNDSLPDERLLLYCAKKLGIPTLCIQDGIFQEANDWRIWHGHYADHMLVWSERQAAVYIKHGMSAERVHVLGLPYSPDASIGRPTNPGAVCFLGQPWETVATQLGRLKLDVFSRAASALNKSGMSCVYKPHPAERRTEYLPQDLAVFRGSLEEAFQQFSVFVSLTSTALLEATLHGRLAVQIFHPDFECDSFEKLGYAYTVDSQNIEKLSALALCTEGALKIPSSSVLLEGTPESRFRAVTSAILSNIG